jgi:hypothetical protein
MLADQDARRSATRSVVLAAVPVAVAAVRTLALAAGAWTGMMPHESLAGTSLL